MEVYSSIIMLVVMVAVLYFLMIRPENKRKKADAEMRSKLKVGDEVQTIGGIVGTVCAVKERHVVIETGADRVRLEFIKEAIATVGKADGSGSDTAKKEKEKKSDEK